MIKWGIAILIVATLTATAWSATTTKEGPCPADMIVVKQTKRYTLCQSKPLPPVRIWK